MERRNNRKALHIREGRLGIVAELYKRGYTIAAIREEVRMRMGVAPSTSTIFHDIHHLLAEWKEARLTDMDDRLQLELAKIDEAERELWEQWEKSKVDYERVSNMRRGQPVQNASGSGEGTIQTYDVAEQKTGINALGNPAYIAEIRQQQIERRKLLGLYAPEKREVRGSISFGDFLVQTSMNDSLGEP